MPNKQTAVLDATQTPTLACAAPDACQCGHEQHDEHNGRHDDHDHAHASEPSISQEDSCACPGEAAGDGGPACSCQAPLRLDEPHDHHDHGAFSWTWRIIAPGILFAFGFIAKGWLETVFGGYGFFAVMAAAYLLCGLPVLREAGEALLRRDFFNEFTLMSLASLVAIALGDTAEAVGVMLFYSLGEAVQEKAAGRSRRSIRALLASKPDTANVLRNGGVERERPENVPIGSSILIKPGEKVPLDGVVLSGNANIDMSSITGEPVPVAAAQGKTVYSGSICLDGDLVVKTTANQSDSMVGKILAMVENAVAMKSRTERFITTFARYYTPAVVALAVLVAVVPPLLFAQPWNTWIYRALVLLVCSCPCALFLSVPLAFFAGIGTASRQGMLVKGGQVFDALAKAKTVVFDKTGTLTRGRLALLATHPAPGVTEDDLLRHAATAEAHSNHPVAAAVLAAAAKRALSPAEATIHDVAGKGIAAESALGRILVGNAKLMSDNGVAFAETETAATVAHVALDGRYLGSLTFADALKPDTAQALADLRAAGVAKAYMLTGDRSEAAEAVAKELGLDGYRAGLLPDEKVKAFRELSPRGEAVFVGDGVNDAPVLAASGVGVAMGALGSAAAVEAADAVILDDSPSRLAQLFAIAARTRRIAGENIFFALAIKTLIMTLGVLGYTGLWTAVFADVGVALLAVLNSMRLARG